MPPPGWCDPLRTASSPWIVNNENDDVSCTSISSLPAAQSSSVTCETERAQETDYSGTGTATSSVSASDLEIW